MLIRFNIPLSNCRGQCYDGASNIGDMIRVERLLRDTMDTTSELSKLIKKSPKRDTMLSKIKEELSLGNPGFRVLCPTRWTVKAGSLKSVLDNWSAIINMLWDNSLEEKLDPEMR